MRKWHAYRLGFVLIVFIILYALVISKLFYWQVIRSQDLREAQRIQSSESLFLPARRGDILTKDKFPLVTNQYSYLLYSNPKIVKDKDIYAQKLSQILSIDQASIAAQLTKDKFWVRIAQGIKEEVKLQIEGLRFQGLGFQQASVRFYPEASMAANMVGFLGKDKDGNDHGYYGLEGFYDQQLQGRPGRMYIIRDALGNPILNDIREESKIDGRTLILNIDRTVQFAVEKRLKDGIEQYGATGGTVIVMEPSSGKALAIASYPSYNPQNYYQFPAESYTDAAISTLYEPGSTFKVLVMAAALDQKKVTPDTRCDICAGPVSIDGYNIRTWDNKYFPDSTMTNVIQRSDNTGMVFVGKKLGQDLFVSYIRNFGFGNPTRIDLAGEESGVVRSEWRAIDLATATFGQGISVTPIQLLTGVNTLANGGFIMKPEVVGKIVTDTGQQIEIKPQVKRRVISESTAKIMTWMMVNAVENGEAKWTKIPNYKIAGKTGTAQIPIGGQYDPTKTIASFVGFFPAEKPKISMLVIVNKPTKSIYGAETAAPIFFQIARDLINYYNIPPSK